MHCNSLYVCSDDPKIWLIGSFVADILIAVVMIAIVSTNMSFYLMLHSNFPLLHSWLKPG